MGLFDNDGKGLLGGLFDFNGDGKTTWDEELLAFKIFEECTKEEGDDNSGLFDDADDFEKYEWRLFCEDGLDFGIIPEDYETEEEYDEALEEARYAWENGLESGVYPDNEYSKGPDAIKTDGITLTLDIKVECPALDRLDKIKEEDFPNKRRYNAAYTLENAFAIYTDGKYEQSLKNRCRFILENADKILAANYLTPDSGFLYAQAVKDNFKLPCSLPDEDESAELDFYEVLLKIAKRNVPLSFEVWDWCLKQFMPYSQYCEGTGKELSTDVIGELLYEFPDSYIRRLVRYLADNPGFCRRMITADDKLSAELSELIAEAIKQELYPTAESLFKTGLEQADGKGKKINSLTGRVIGECENGEELESIEYFRDNLLPLVKAIPIGIVQNKIQNWEKDIAEYISCVEDECEQYAFTRKNAWRKTVPSGKKYGLDPRGYDTQQEYLDALNEEKYSWREWYKDDDNYGLNPDDFETEKKYQNALNAKIKEARAQEQGEKIKKQPPSRPAKFKEYADDKTVYTYCGVLLSFSAQPYSFRTEDTTIQVGDTVIVPVGDDENEMKGTVVSIGQYLRAGVPYPVEKTKMIIRKITEEQSNG